MTTLTSDDFAGLGTSDLSGRTLNNSLGGSGAYTWISSGLAGDGSGAVGGTNPAHSALVAVAGVNKCRVRVSPTGAENMILWGRLNSAGPETGIGLLLVGQTSLRVSSFNAGSRIDHQSMVITAPGTTFWMEVEVSGLVVTCRILNNDTSIRDTLSHTFSGSVPSGGDLWGFGFFQDGNNSKFDDFIVDDGGSADTEKPVLTGTPTVGTKTSSSIQITGPAGSDNVGITAYEFSLDGGATWPLSSPTLPYNITNLAALTSYTVGMRARDAAGNISDPIFVTTSTYRGGALASTILLLTGPQGGNPAGFLYDFASTVATSAWLSYTIVSGPTPAGGSLDANAMGAFSYTGPAPATMVIQPEVNGANAPETITVTLYDNSVSLGAAPMASTPTYGSGPVSQAAPVPLTGTAVAVASAYGSGQIAQAAPVALMGAALSVSTAYGPGAISDAPTFTSLAPSPVCATYRRDSYPAHTFQKLAGETLDFDIDFRYELRSTQDSARIHDPVEIQAGQGVDVLGAYWVPGLRRVKLWVSGGEAQGKSDISIWLNTEAGRRLQVDVRVQIR